MIRFETLLEKVRSYSPEADLELLRRAYVFSALEHKGQVRHSGEPYLIHPLEVADSLLKGPPLLYLFRPSNYVLAAGMLPAPLRERFGLSWALPVRAAYGLGVSLVRGIVPRLPSQLRFVPSSRRAERRCLRHARLAA